jgi:hypothetical protein
MSKSSDAAIHDMNRKADRPRKGVQSPKPVAVPTPIPDEPQPEGSYRDFPVLAALPEMLLAYRDLQLQIAAISKLEAQKKELGQSIEALLLAAGAKTVTAGALRCTHVEVAGRKSISADRLLSFGVPADTIVAATVTGNPSSHIKVTAIDEAMHEARNGHGSPAELKYGS